MDEQLGQVTGFPTLRITATGAGVPAPEVKWMDQVQKPGLLFSVHSTSLQALAQPPDEGFAGDVVLILYLRAS